MSCGEERGEVNVTGGEPLPAEGTYECGDGLCHPSEDALSCELDCAYCGDQVCNAMESEESCPQDCVAQPPQVTLDMTVELNSTLNEVSCGDGVCDTQEGPQSCPQDCEIDPEALVTPPPAGPAPDPNADVIGYVDSVALREGRWIVRGWACHVGWSPSVEVVVYAGGDITRGRFVKRALADEPQEDAIGVACEVEEGAHRFTIPLSEEELTEFAGQAIHVHAVSPVGREDRALNRSGEHLLPGDSGGLGGGSTGGSLPVDLDLVTWLHTDASAWPITSQLSVSFQGGSICLEYDKKDVWPPVAIPRSSGDGDVDVVANPWVILDYNGQWYAATWEWLAVGSSCKSKSAVAGDHIKQFAHIPEDWRPGPGQTLYFMVSSLARFAHISNVQERTDIVEVTWE